MNFTRNSVDGIYDIEATVPKVRFPMGYRPMPGRTGTRLMLQALLSDRFKLVIRREMKEIPVYALVVGRGSVRSSRRRISKKKIVRKSWRVRGRDRLFVIDFYGGRGRGLHARQ